jgi:transposase-like protein/IS1 family transposase
MNCPQCSQQALKFGKNRNGSQRWICRACHKTFSEQSNDNRRTDQAKLMIALKMLLEGTSIRSAQRLTSLSRDTIISTMVSAGQKCQRFLENVLKSCPVGNVEADEIWGFVGCKEKTAQKNGYGPEVGDAWCWIGIERETKLILTWHIGKRSPEDAQIFASKFRDVTSGHFQLTTDAYGPYRKAISDAFGQTIDYALLAKTYGASRPLPGATSSLPNASTRYSPASMIKIDTIIQIGSPDEDLICTSHVERNNLQIRMAMRRMTRLTNGHSKKWANHEAAFALYFAFYNFVRPHMTLTENAGRKTTPAMAAGLTDHVWTLEELLAEAAK